MIRFEDNRNSQDLDCLLSLLLRVMRSASLATAESDLDCMIFLLSRQMFIDMSAVVTVTYVATVCRHAQLAQHGCTTSNRKSGTSSGSIMGGEVSTAYKE